jgi:hypothetical protein
MYYILHISTGMYINRCWFGGSMLEDNVKFYATEKAAGKSLYSILKYGWVCNRNTYDAIQVDAADFLIIKK